jgi:hypothetical protein
MRTIASSRGGCAEKIYIRTRPPVRRARNSPAAVALKVNALRCENQSIAPYYNDVYALATLNKGRNRLYC